MVIESYSKFRDRKFFSSFSCHVRKFTVPFEITALVPNLLFYSTLLKSQNLDILQKFPRIPTVIE